MQYKIYFLQISELKAVMWRQQRKQTSKLLSIHLLHLVFVWNCSGHWRMCPIFAILHRSVLRIPSPPNITVSHKDPTTSPPHTQALNKNFVQWTPVNQTFTQLTMFGQFITCFEWVSATVTFRCQNWVLAGSTFGREEQARLYRWHPWDGNVIAFTIQCWVPSKL